MSDVEATQPSTSVRPPDDAEKTKPSAQTLEESSNAWTPRDLGDAAPVGPPRMPASGGEADLDLHKALRRFHFTGERSRPELDSASGASWRPAVLTPWLTPGLPWGDYPLYLPPSDAEDTRVVSLASLVRTAMTSSKANGADANILEENLWRLTRATARVLEARDGSGSFHEIFDEGTKAFLRDVGETEWAAMQAQLEGLAETLPREGTLLGMGGHTAVALYAAIVSRRRKTVRETFHAEVDELTAQLNDTLQVDQMHSVEGASPERLSGAMGGVADAYMDAEALAGTLPAYRGSRSIEPDRRLRIERTIRVLEQYVEAAETAGDFILVHSGDLPDGLRLPEGAAVRHADGLAASIECFNEISCELVSVVRALRTARLEVAGQYDPALHDEPLARIDRESLSAEELTLSRAVVALERAETLEGNKVSSLSLVLQSGLPIHVLVMGHTLELGHPDPGLGYRSIAHRAAYVLQTTVVQPEHLAGGLEDMVRSAGPAVAFIEGHPWSVGDALPWLHSVADHQGRVSPCFQYVPDAGDSWATRFVLSSNAQPDEAWPRYTVPCVGTGGEELTLDLRLTFAESVALDAAFQNHFCIIPANAWGENQVELSEYLAAADSEPRAEVPFIWVVDDDGFLQRAVPTRDLVLACWERMRSWRILQELGGIENEYASRAVSRVKAESQDALEALRSELKAAHAEDIERIRAEVTEETVQRVVAGLLGLDSVPPPAPLVALQAAPIQPAAEPQVQDEAAEVTEAVAIEDPYIDTPLCTTCDECTNLNPRLFKYDDNKQAYIADPAAGTFRELVKAAIACPACIIHPGSPRPGDETATDALRAKAAEFN